VTEAESTTAFDLVHVTPQEAAPIVGVARTPTALYVGDSYLVQAERERAAARSPKDRFRLWLDCVNARAYETRWYGRANAIACPSADDATTMRSLYGVDVDVVPIPVGDEWFAAPTIERCADLVTLTGALDYWPNVDGVVWFAGEVWPRVIASWPAARLRVVGRSPTAAVHDTVVAAGGEVIADVPDMRPYYWEAAVVVAPTRLGSGVKNKVLHAAACSAPQVGTTFAFAGTSARAGADVLMGDDADDLAAAVVATLADPDAAARRAGSARRIADEHRVQRVTDAWEKFWQRAVSV
jgi:glycosyltransferase involved in cell wall biosynthesis